MNKPQKHTEKTKSLASKLQSKDIFNWLVSYGYYPESYVLPPCFYVTKHPVFGKVFFPINKRKINPKISQICELHFPKSDLTDRTFGIIDPEIHNDIAYEIAKNWKIITDLLFNKDKLVYSYSFPIPLNSKTPGGVGHLRAGRLIYEWIAMAENDLVEEAYEYKYLFKTDITNFYPSIYTHSIAWAIHSKKTLRSSNKRYDFTLLGNRLDKLFQNANDGCTNGIPVGPVVSDLIAEIILSAVDCKISHVLKRNKILCVRFKDDYRFLCKDKQSGRDAIKSLQKELKEFSLLLNEGKTEISDLPEGIFRAWVSKYSVIEPRKYKKLTFKEFKETYLGVLRIDKETPGTGIVDRFLADLVDNRYKPLLPVSSKHAKKSISLLLLLAEKRIKAFPKIVALIESMMSIQTSSNFKRSIENHLNNHLKDLSKNTDDNRYLIAWIIYFLKSNKMGIKAKLVLDDRVLKTINSNQNLIFKGCKDFKIYRSISASKKSGSLLRYLDTFKPQ
jgi:hypothetical protein